MRRYNAAVRRLIINADDFGLTAGVNRAIAETHTRGIVTSATLMANSSAFEDAVRLTAGLPEISVGCHVILVDGAPLLEPAKVSTLVKKNDANSGEFRTSLSAFAGSALTGRLDEAQIEAEAAAQIQRLEAAGIQVSHVDTHKHAHMFPVVFRAVLRAARAHGIGAIRNPFAPRMPLSIRVLRQRPGLWKRYVQVRGLRRLRASFLRAVGDAGMVTTEGCLGVVATGTLDFPLFEKIVESMPPGTWEFVCHPGYSDSDLQGVKTRLRESRQHELQLLTSSEARSVLTRHGIELLSYRDLTASSKLRPSH